MRKLAEVLLVIFAIFLIIESISQFAGSHFAIASNASVSELIYMVGPSVTFLLSGTLILIYRVALTDWILRGEYPELSEKIDIDKIERVILSILGLLIFFGMFPHLLMAINYYVIAPEFQRSPYGDIPLEDFAFVQAIAFTFESFAAAFLIFFPQKIQKVLHKTRCL